MTSREFIGGWYADALPNGNYVATWRDGRIEANGSAIGPPPNGAILPLYPRLRTGAVLEFAGQEWQAHDRALVWHALTGWTVDDRVACGVSPCIYDHDGTLHVNVGCAAGSQGWRYVTEDNQLITGDATYGPTAAWRLWEWTQLDTDLVIGQGENGGCLVWDRGQMRYLIAESAGVPRFIRAVRDGDDVSVAYWGQSGVPSAAHWLTVAELRALPLAGTPAPTPPLPPTPEPPMTQMPTAAWALIQECHRRFAFALPVTEDGARQFTKLCIEQLAYNFPQEGWCWKAADPGRPVSKDIVARQSAGRMDGWDILNAASLNGPRLLVDVPGWHDLSGQFPIVAGQNHQGWVWTPTNHLDLPVPVPPTPQPPPPVPPVPGQPTNADVLAAVNALRADFARVFR